MQYVFCATHRSEDLMENPGELLHCLPGFCLGKQEFALPLLPQAVAAVASCQHQGGEAGCALSGKDFPDIMHAGPWAQVATRSVAAASFTGNYREQLCVKSSVWQRAQSNPQRCLSHLPKGSCNENKWLSMKPVCSVGNNENKHKAAKDPFSGCVSLLPTVTLSPVSPRMDP